MRHRSPVFAIGLAVVTAVTISVAAPVGAGPAGPGDRSAAPTTVAVIGDVPYGTAQEAIVGNLVDAVNGDPKVRTVVHVGDIKSGSTTCTDERLAAVRRTFDSFEDPVVYTPGDNEWTDCHRVNNGRYNPLERLDAVRSTFFAAPGSVLGRHPMRVDFQSALVENVRWVASRVAFATLHLIGSNNGLAPWSGLGFTAPTPEQRAEVDARVAATVAWVDATFDAAEDGGLLGVVLAMQADTFPVPASGQQAVIDRITTRTAGFDGQVLLLQGDSHQYVADHPLGVPNLTRIVVHGETLPFEYLRLSIDRRHPALFSWERVQVQP